MDNHRAARILTRERPLFVQAPEKWAPFTLERLTAEVMDRLKVLSSLGAIQSRARQSNVGLKVDERKMEWRRGHRWAEYQTDPIVWDKDQGRPYGEDDDEPDYMVRVPGRWPRGVKQLSDQEWPVAGTTQYEEAVAAFIESSERSLELVPKPTNPHDPNAIKVVGRWRDPQGRELEGTVGYLPRDAAATLATRDRRMKLHARAVLLFVPRPEQGKSGGIRLKLGWSVGEISAPRGSGRRVRAGRKPTGCLVMVLAAIGTAILFAAS